MLRIENDTGSAWHTRVLTDDGADIAQQLVFDKIEIEVPNGAHHVNATLHLAITRFSLPARTAKWVTRNPATGDIEKLASLVFASGTVVQFKDDGELVLKVPRPAD